jgi:hypothetical protein
LSNLVEQQVDRRGRAPGRCSSVVKVKLLKASMRHSCSHATGAMSWLTADLAGEDAPDCAGALIMRSKVAAMQGNVRCQSLRTFSSNAMDAIRPSFRTGALINGRVQIPASMPEPASGGVILRSRVQQIANFSAELCSSSDPEGCRVASSARGR